MKVCTKCGIEKPDEDYYKVRPDKPWRRSVCKECHKAYQSERYHADIELHRKANRIYAENYRKAHPDELRAYRRAWMRKRRSA